MKNILHSKGWILGAVQIHPDPPPIPLNKSKNDAKLDKDCVKNKLCMDPTSEKSDLYELKIALFDNGEPKEFFLFVRNFQMNLEAPGTPYSYAITWLGVMST